MMIMGVPRGEEGMVIKVDGTRLMRSGEVALWCNGSIVWSGAVGAHVCDVAFDAVSMHVDDGVRMLATVGDQPTADLVLSVLAGWWD